MKREKFYLQWLTVIKKISVVITLSYNYAEQN